MTSKDLLVEFIVRAINERAVDISSANSENLALVTVVSKSNEYMYIVYDPGQLMKLITKLKKSDSVVTHSKLLENSDDFLRGMIQVFEGHKDEAWDAAEITLSAATKGYGPLMYDIALALHGRIMPDRVAVSSAAENIWSKYMKSRSDVKKLPLDNVNDPKTPSTEDDSTFHDPANLTNPLNYAYQATSTPDVSRLETNHIMSLKRFASYVSESLDDDFFWYAAKKFFTKKYVASATSI